MSKSRHGLAELGLISHIQETFAAIPDRRAAVSLGIGDDCAILRPPRGWEVLVTTDLLLEGRHFRRDTHPAASAGHRCLARGLSDVSAMGGRSLAAFLSLALPYGSLRQSDESMWVEGFLDGMRRLAARYEVSLAGGDTAEMPETAGTMAIADIVLVGAAPRGEALRRSGARPGDRLYCTGSLGGAAAELRTLLERANGQQSRDAEAEAGWETRAIEGDHPQLFPQPRVAVGEALRRRGLATAAIDVSDGLSTDLRHVCRASGVSAEVWEAALPVHPLAQLLPEQEQTWAVLHGGEDYELLFTARPEARVPRRIAGVPVTEVGRMVEAEAGEPRVVLVGSEGPSGLEPQGFEHFSM